VGAAGVTSCTEVHRLWKVMGLGSTWMAACTMEGLWAEADAGATRSCRVGRLWVEARRLGTGRLWERMDAPCRLVDRRWGIWGEEEEEARRRSEGAVVGGAGKQPLVLNNSSANPFHTPALHSLCPCLGGPHAVVTLLSLALHFQCSRHPVLGGDGRAPPPPLPPLEASSSCIEETRGTSTPAPTVPPNQTDMFSMLSTRTNIHAVSSRTSQLRATRVVPSTIARPVPRARARALTVNASGTLRLSSPQRRAFKLPRVSYV